MTDASMAQKLIAILRNDLERLERIDNYDKGNHDDPWMPENATEEYKLLVKRSVSNWMPLLVATPCQSLYVDGFRRGQVDEERDPVVARGNQPEWDHWQRSRMDALQHPVHRGAVKFGHSFVLTERDRRKGVVSKGLSAMRTTVAFDDPANDDDPRCAIYIKKWPSIVDGKPVRGQARVWTETLVYDNATFTLDETEKIKVQLGSSRRHGASRCPVTRFAAYVDLEGRTVGVVEPMIELQNRMNQTVFDLLLAQTYNSTEVRTVSGMVPKLQMEQDATTGEWVPKRDEFGQPIPIPMNYNASRFLFAPDAETKFSSLPGSPLDGFINSLDMSIRHLSAISQTPPHYLLGQIANLSAEALNAAELALLRKVQEFQSVFGESWERVFRIATELAGEPLDEEDYSGEVIWRDVQQRSLAQAADGLGKLREQLGIPAEGLWARVPNVTQNELATWRELAKQEDSAGTLANALQRATAGVEQAQSAQAQQQQMQLGALPAPSASAA